MDTPELLLEIEHLKTLMSRYAQWGDAQRWELFATLFAEDVHYTADAAPRPNAEADGSLDIRGRDAFIQGMTEFTSGLHTAHQMYLPDITVHDDGTASAIWGLHDQIRSPVGTFSRYGHISQEYRKTDGAWKITRSHSSTLLLDETWTADGGE
ncbi:nuclear transport factor 2 family protein [Streptomyces sp. J2-1]|uniref:nuclear transport factor 2 family protein n=1 Tax=Streptomyces corallincola TaxID=2851888 RepID=UPI001C38FFD9|nr:nuclear transport factor 2 family protein [Streptomyces corallincola]MBV2357598.1 nuclear transport factor 2 family protein [Streptomyces corallincola]